jgi:NAD(P)-dependent dehydrogenase (short-subunit alcohol dehydrogenase family)
LTPPAPGAIAAVIEAGERRMDKVLIVTGGSRGIGAAVARGAAAPGWTVVLSYRTRAERAEAVVRDITTAGGHAVAVQADVAREDDVARLFDTAARHGRIAGLVNNAGINGDPVRMADLAPADFSAMFATNVTGVFLCAAEAVRRMSTARGGAGGAIVNIGSVAVRLGAAGERVLEVAREGIRVNCVSPGLFATEMNPPERVARLTPAIPIGRVGAPDELANVVLFLLSDAASYVLGAEVTVSGGR